MKLKISIQSATIITLLEKPYEYQGRTGISYKADVLVDGSVEKLKLTEEAYRQLEIGHTYALSAELFMSGSTCSLKITGIED